MRMAPRCKRHSPPHAFEYYTAEVEKIKNEAAGPSPTPMASTPAVLPVPNDFPHNWLGAIEVGQAVTFRGLEYHSTNQPIQSVQSAQSINKQIPPTHQSSLAQQSWQLELKYTTGNGRHASPDPGYAQ